MDRYVRNLRLNSDTFTIRSVGIVNFKFFELNCFSICLGTQNSTVA